MNLCEFSHYIRESSDLVLSKQQSRCGRSRLCSIQSTGRGLLGGTPRRPIRVNEKLCALRLIRAAELVEAAVHRRSPATPSLRTIRSSASCREIRRARVVGAFHDRQSALNHVAARPGRSPAPHGTVAASAGEGRSALAHRLQRHLRPPRNLLFFSINRVLISQHCIFQLIFAFIQP